ncbi:MAG: adenosylcobinamide-phosphate synthase CbiB [Pseudomonadota bacterium]
MTPPFILLLALLLDAALGEPDWLWRRAPHPAVLMGRAIGWADRLLNRGAYRRAKGVLLVAGLILSAGLIGWGLSLLGGLVDVLVTAVLLAHRSLVQHVRAVGDGLRRALSEGRAAVALIVSRDTAEMSSAAVSRAAIESGAENLSDGVVAPAFWFLIGGLPGLLIYKAVNTADSMVGYLTPRYAAFGWAAARLDDALNWIPARLTAVLIALPGAVLPQWSEVRADARLHRSPNAGWPEAALSRAIGVALAGPRAYAGEMRAFAWVNPTGQRDIGPAEIDAALRQMWLAWGCLVMVMLITVLISAVL